MYVDIVRLRMFNVGCHIQSVFLGCLLYADDMILICPSVQGLRVMLNVCVLISSELALDFNARKSYCIAFGKLTVKHDIEPMPLGNDNIQWVSSFKYLGVTICGGKSLSLTLLQLKDPSLQMPIVFLHTLRGWMN